MSRLSVLDLARYRAGAVAETVADADAACRELGFLLVAGHEVDTSLIREMRAVSAAPRVAPCTAASTSRAARVSSGGSRRASNCRLPRMIISRLLKSCATPLVRLPSASSFCAST